MPGLSNLNTSLYHGEARRPKSRTVTEGDSDKDHKEDVRLGVGEGERDGASPGVEGLVGDFESIGISMLG
jgi:hypothetical protein